MKLVIVWSVLWSIVVYWSWVVWHQACNPMVDISNDLSSL
uniref:ATP synthase F0 subunit 8 n=1 Tax=Crassostrea ariakensis TaxID=3244846 RepID=A0A0A0QJ22_CRAAR|nr:ATP synthase F0 subunit 8 [Crassostrea ariakensis]AIM52322.1 ATP synthase F0 subunit 8 [Crassostrea ariakensis]AIM52335.1 ATP synthase F0 subunit 8 [Crassostrea ariakensis]AIM52348.1 ATP synthase F0 subunit 8 [Crassostrea ariakensis]AIM52361.1 ATP synthase F0 subunit 8 [Crassostrea ariakensis]